MMFRTESPGKWNRTGTGLAVVLLVLTALIGVTTVQAEEGQNHLISDAADSFVSDAGLTIWTDVFEQTDEARLGWAASVCALVDADALQADEQGTATLMTDAYKQYGQPPCSDHPFAQQPTAALCAGFVVADDLIATSAACLNESTPLAAYRFVFGFEMSADASVALSFYEDQLYTPVDIVASDGEFALLRVDRPITVAQALPLALSPAVAGEEAVVIAYPAGLPEKIAAGPFTPTEAGLAVTVDPLGDLSGAPVILSATGEVAGILSGGEALSTADSPCFAYPASGDASFAGFMTPASSFAAYVPDSAFEKQIDDDLIVDLDAEGEEEELADEAEINFETLVRDKEALLPLHDWVPLFRFTMAYGDDAYAPRYLSKLEYELVAADPDDEEFMVRGKPSASDILEFAIFDDFYTEDDEAGEDRYGNLDTGDYLLLSWDGTGAPYGTNDGVKYSMTFKESDRIISLPKIDDYLPDGAAYIVAVRTSATWRSALSMGVKVTWAEMVDPETGESYLGDGGEDDNVPADSYSPSFIEGETLDDEVYYSSSFGVFDPTGPDLGGINFLEGWETIPTPNFFQYTPYLSIPLAEFSRPRWNKPDTLLSIATGQYLNIRSLMPLESWMPVIGINIHSSRSLLSGLKEDFPYAVLREVNVVFTDEGGDPKGYPGNGGFNPKQALKPIGHGTDETFGTTHVGYNGIWVWEDTNRNGIFDPPTPTAGGVGGFSYNGDMPLASLGMHTEWEHIAEPPGGGSPWWKIKLTFAGTEDNPEAYLTEKIPNNVLPGEIGLGSEFSYDYFVVARFDSGFKDISSMASGQAGATLGSQFKAFIEPRRKDSFTQQWEGGIYATSQIFRRDEREVYVIPRNPAWQDEPAWGTEPWWPERTLNVHASKTHRQGLEVLDLVQTYMGASMDSNRYDEIYASNHFPTGLICKCKELTNVPLGFSSFGSSTLAAWLDPFGLNQSRFANNHEPDVYSFTALEVVHKFTLFGQPMLLGGALLGVPQFSFETRPFYFKYYDEPTWGPRSSAYPVPDPELSFPHYETWPGSSQGSGFPRLSDWAPEDARARLLTQKVERRSKHTPMLGFNLAGSSDPIVNSEGNSMELAELHVAFWGPDFKPEILRSLDPYKNKNESLDSGVLLWQQAMDLNTEEGGEDSEISSSLPVIFMNTEEVSYYGDTPLPLYHKMIPVTGLAWKSAPEYIDIDGDGMPDDMNGDGLVDDRDKAWVLTLRPTNNWELPKDDLTGTSTGGIDLILTVKTSDAIARFQKFRAVVPATLPERTVNNRKAGIQFWPQVNTSPRAFTKTHPEEGPVQSYYGHDMLEANVPAAVVDMTGRWADMDIGGAAVPLLGLDLATNVQTVRESGDRGTGRDKSFHVSGADWTENIYAGDVLVDERYESYEILSNNENTLFLLSGKPRDGAWHIVQDPTYLEEVTVELYQEGSHAAFNPLTDLLPLDIDQQVSGLAIYRDNDNHPNNRNGVFDPDIDIPLSLDCPPRFMGQTGDAIKVRFCFSLPGTGDFPKSRDRQPRNRQWIYDGFGDGTASFETGPDFFIVIRASNEMHTGDKLRAAIVSWGPATPTEPDPHIWANLPGEDRHDYKLFREFIWAERGLGFVTHFKEPPLYYYMDEARAGQRADRSGYNWIRSHSAVKGRSGVVTAKKRAEGPRSLSIDSVSQRVLPVQTFAGAPFDFLIRGNNFGDIATVALSGYEVTVLRSANEEIHVSIETRDGIVPQEPITLIVRNPKTGDEMSRSDLFSLSNTVTVKGPKIFGVYPSVVRKEDFPVTMKGANFAGNDFVAVHFGETLMPVLDISEDGTAMKIGWPQGGLPVPGKLNVAVRTQGVNGGQTVMVDGVEYINPEIRNKAGLLGCGPAEESGRIGWLGDLTLLAALGAALTFSRRRFRSFTLLLVLTLLFAVTPGQAFFPKGGWNYFQQLRYATWAFKEFDTDENGTVDKGEGLEFRIESGPRGFTPDEMELVKAAFQTWENVPSSYVAFRFAGAIEDPIAPAAVYTDYLPMVYMQVSDVSALDSYSQIDDDDIFVPGLDSFQPALTFLLYTIDQTIISELGGNSVMVPAGTILDCDIVVNANLHRPGLLPATTFGLLDLQATVTHQVGQLLGLSFTPLNNLDPYNSVLLSGASDGLSVEPAVLQMTGADGIARAVGATPTMFPIYFLTENGYGDYTAGWRDLAPDDISGISWLYPRKDGQSNFFSVSQEARTHVRRTTGIPPVPVSGGHVVAWASLSANDNERRVPLFSTMTGLYERYVNLQLSGRFALHGLWKQLEVPGGINEFYEPSYVLTLNPLNGLGYERQAPPGLSSSEFDSLQGDFPISFSYDARPSDYFSSGYPSEVFNEDGNIYGIDNNTVGTPLIWSFEKNTLISKTTGKTVPHILPTNVPMFGDPDTVCPMNIIENTDGYTSDITDGETIPDISLLGTLGGSGGGGSGGISSFNNKLRSFRDGTLLRSAAGTALVDAFYRVSPFVSGQLQRHASLVTFFRSAALLLAAALELAGWWLLALLFLPVALFLLRKKGRKEVFVGAMIVLFLIVSVTGHAGQLPLTTDTLVAQADVIVKGTVLSAEARMDHRNRIFTDVVLKVQDVVKGNVNRGSNLTFSVIGGVYGTLAMTAPGIPNFSSDEKVLLYLSEVPGYGLMPYGGLKSKLNIFLEETTGEEVLNMSEDDPEVNPTTEKETKSLVAEPVDESQDTEGEVLEEVPVSGRMPVSEYLDYLRSLVRNQRFL